MCTSPVLSFYSDIHLFLYESTNNCGLSFLHLGRVVGTDKHEIRIHSSTHHPIIIIQKLFQNKYNKKSINDSLFNLI